MKRLLALISLCLCLCLAPLASPVPAAESPVKVTFLSPCPMGSQPFWEQYVAFMQTAARSLCIDLEVIYAKHRFAVEQNARMVVTRKERPDYILYIYQAQNSRGVLDMLESAGIRSLIVNTDVIPKERAAVGHPREKYKSWIGHLYPDDALAGRQLAVRLIREGIDHGLTDNDRRLHVVGIGGARDATSGIYRMSGLLQAMHDNPLVVLDRFVWADWQRDKARSKTLALLEIHPDARVYWAAHDHTSLGVLDAVEELGIKAGKNFFTGSIGWTPECIEAVRDGRLATAIGGHFMDGAWALIMILDYHNGHDFAAPAPTLNSEMRLIDRANLDRYIPVLDHENWKKIDFKLFSKTHNPSLEEYDFTPDAVVRQLNGK